MPSLEGPPEPVVVTQADRDVLKAIYVPATHEAIDRGDYDTHDDAQAIAKHRLSHTLPDERLRTELERVLSDFVDRREFGSSPPEDNEDWRRGFVDALDCLREELKPWWPFARPLDLSSLRPAADERLRVAVEAMQQDHMTSEGHHPDYVLVPAGAFRRAMEALASLQETTP